MKKLLRENLFAVMENIFSNISGVKTLILVQFETYTYILYFDSGLALYWIEISKKYLTE